VVFDLRPAGPVARFAAFAIDLMIRGVLYFILLMVFAQLGKLGFGILLILMFLLEWFYPVLFEVYFGGATPGKRMMGICVVEDSGLPVGMAASITRNLLRFADFLPFFYGFGVMSMILTRDFKRLGDLAAGTQVVYRDPQDKQRRFPDVEPVAPERVPPLEVQQAVIALAERSTRLTDERVDELTELAERVLGVPPARNRGAQRMFGIAQWLMGRR
jgi:uncharacterized RDD family membrane protein YckC